MGREAFKHSSLKLFKALKVNICSENRTQIYWQSNTNDAAKVHPYASQQSHSSILYKLSLQECLQLQPHVQPWANTVRSDDARKDASA